MGLLFKTTCFVVGSGTESADKPVADHSRMKDDATTSAPPGAQPVYIMLPTSTGSTVPQRPLIDTEVLREVGETLRCGAIFVSIVAIVSLTVTLFVWKFFK